MSYLDSSTLNIFLTCIHRENHSQHFILNRVCCGFGGAQGELRRGADEARVVDATKQRLARLPALDRPVYPFCAMRIAELILRMGAYYTRFSSTVQDHALPAIYGACGCGRPSARSRWLRCGWSAIRRPRRRRHLGSHRTSDSCGAYTRAP